MNIYGQLFAIGMAGGIGSLFRYGIGRLTPMMLGTSFPWGTFVANIIGCMLFGFLSEHLSANRIPEEWKPILLTGFLGGLTTFSAFSFENYQLLESKQTTLFALNMISQNALGILAVLAGIALAAKWTTT